MALNSNPCRVLLVTNRNFSDWTMSEENKPRMPLTYALAEGLINAGYKLSAIAADTNSDEIISRQDKYPFERLYSHTDLSKALSENDIAILWGRPGSIGLFRQAFRIKGERQIILLSYEWDSSSASILKNFKLMLTRFLARSSRCLIVMTEEQKTSASKYFRGEVPVKKLTVGIDTRFYQSPISIKDIPSTERELIDRVTAAPFVVMPGCELRLNTDAIDLLENSTLNMVRITQLGHKNGVNELKEQIQSKGLGGRLYVLEGISHLALKFLMRNSLVYAGLVDSSWQPAGWTVACESLASGTPIVLYEGIVSRELQLLGASSLIMKVVTKGDVNGFRDAIYEVISCPSRHRAESEAQSFAQEKLNFERNIPAFLETIN